ncbi:MAG TPA: Ig-like domain-containing protein [Ferruginibacter sp.]|nr:Ig-like domain-containing protein [Ferruginibacter sp.]
MKKIITKTQWFFLLTATLILTSLGCRRDIDGLVAPDLPATAEVFIDDFTSDLAYAAFGGSDVRAFQVDNQVSYAGTAASMRFEVPDANSPQGSYAGGVFYSRTGRNLSGFNAISFYIKASQPATIGVMGLGNDLGENKFLVSLQNTPVNSNWKKVYIPIPDPAKLTNEKGLFYYSAGPENGRGYTIWIDEVRFEQVPDLGTVTGVIFNGQDRVIGNAETGDRIQVDGLETRVNLPSGVNQTVGVSPHYFTFTSSNTGVASVNETGLVQVNDAGTATVKALLAGEEAIGSLQITSTGTPVGPTSAAPNPTQDPSNVVSLYSNAYSNVPVDTWNTRWQFSTAEEFFIQVAGNDVIRYRNLNFVGIEFKTPPVNASAMRFFHMDLWTPDATNLPNNFKILLVDFGANGVFGGGDDSQHEITVTSPTLVSNNWVSIDVPLSSFTGLASTANLAQLVLSGSLPNVYVDNIYFYRNPVTPATAAPAPSADAANVLSVFSDSYTNVPGTDFFPNWGQSTVVTQVPIAGNNTLQYANFNYQGVQLGSSQNVSGYNYLHLDYYTTNASTLRVFLISPGPVETPFTLTVPTSGWNSVDIPLSAFAPVDLSNVIQFKFDGGGNSDIYLDNIYFWRLPITPSVAAPVPGYPAGDVISIFSDSYTNVPGSDLNPNWGQATVVTQTAIGGNNTLVYTGLNYQGLQFGSNQDVSGKTFLHLDYYSANSTSLRIFLISPGPVETPFTLNVPTSSGWNSIDIPLSAFAPVALNNVFQLKFEGNGTIYLDNILFR